MTVVALINRIDCRFSSLKEAGRAGLITFVTANDPDADTSLALLKSLPSAGADIIELGMPFTDPMADGPVIQASSLRALRAGGSLRQTLDLVKSFRDHNDETPIVLMGYFNPIFVYGVEHFLTDAVAAGVDGLIIVDLPYEEDRELCIPAMEAGLAFIRLVTPTTDDHRLASILSNTAGFVYYVSITGITGSSMGESGVIEEAIVRLRRHTKLPIAVGFGVKTPNQAANIARHADAVVVGSALISRVAESLTLSGTAGPQLIEHTLSLVRDLSSGIRGAGKIHSLSEPGSNE